MNNAEVHFIFTIDEEGLRKLALVEDMGYEDDPNCPHPDQFVDVITDMMRQAFWESACTEGCMEVSCSEEVKDVFDLYKVSRERFGGPLERLAYETKRDPFNMVYKTLCMWCEGVSIHKTKVPPTYCPLCNNCAVHSYEFCAKEDSVHPMFGPDCEPISDGLADHS